MIGWPHPYFEEIATVKWLNRTFGYSLTVPEFLADDSLWDEWHLDMHFYYADAFGDASLMEKAREHREKFVRRGFFAALYELSDSNE